MLPVPIHAPSPAVSVEARWTVPVIVGRTVLTGGALDTSVVAALAAVAIPSGLVTVTRSRSCAPTSSVVSVYDMPVAPGMLHAARGSHWYVNVLPMPAQVPDAPVSVEAALRAARDRRAARCSTGAALGTVAVAVLAAASKPSGLEPVTTTRIALPTSSGVSV